MAGPSFSFGKGVNAATQASLPTCNPCKEKDHGRCATVLAQNGVFESAFECACFKRDEDEHDIAFQDRQEAHDNRGEGYFHPETDYAPMGYYASQRREAQRWGGVEY